MPEKPGIFIVCDAAPGSALEADRISAALTTRGHRVGILARSAPGGAEDFTFALQVGYSLWHRRREFDLVCFFGAGPHLGPGLSVAYLLRKAIATRFSVDGTFTAMSRTAVGQFEMGWLRDWQVPLILPDPVMLGQAEGAGFHRDQLVSIPAMVDTDAFRPASPDDVAAWRQKHNIPIDAKVVICTGKLTSEKGLADLMFGIAHAGQSAPAAMLVIVGDGPARQELTTLGRQLDSTATRYRFTGAVPSAEVPAWLASADVFARLASAQNSPSSLLEAMATGLPSVVSNIVGHMRIMQNQVHGLSVSPGELEPLSTALTSLFLDPTLRHRLGSAARERVVENYSVEALLPLYEALFARTSPPRP